MTTGDCLKPTLYIAWLSMVSKTDIFTKEREFHEMNMLSYLNCFVA